MTSTAPTFAIPPASTVAPRWLGRGMQLCVQGRTLESPFVFAGRRLPGPWSAAVDVELPARLEGLAGRPRASAYAHLTSRQRHGFLEWLAGGRRGKVSEPPILVAFLAGAEQFLLDDSLGRTVEEEQDLYEELLLLAECYRTAHPEQATQFLWLRDYAWIRRRATAKPGTPLAPDLRQSAGVSAGLALRWRAGELLSNDKPISAALAYQFALSHLTGPELRRLPVFEKEFAWLFAHHFAEQFGRAMPISDASLVDEVIAYRTVGAPLLGQRCRLSRPAPVMVASTELRNNIAQITIRCLEELADFISVRMEGTTAEEAWAKLPVGLWPAKPRNVFRSLVASALVSPIAVTYEQMAPYFVAGPAMTAKNLSRVSSGLAQVGLTSYPQLPFAKPASVRTPFMIYSLDGVSVGERIEDPEVEPLLLALRLASMESPASTEDSSSLPPLFERIQAQVRADDSLTVALRRQRGAAIHWAQTEALKAVTRAQWGKTPAAAREAASAVLAKLLAPLHELPPTPALDAMLGPTWLALKAKPFQLDTSRVEQLTAETGAVHQLLGALFEDEPSAAVSTAPAPLASPAATGPAEARKAFLRHLVGMTSIAAADLQALAASLSLMPNGTVEWANELAYDVAGQPALEELNDEWMVAADIVAELLGHLGA